MFYPYFGTLEVLHFDLNALCSRQTCSSPVHRAIDDVFDIIPASLKWVSFRLQDHLVTTQKHLKLGRDEAA